MVDKTTAAKTPPATAPAPESLSTCGNACPAAAAMWERGLGVDTGVRLPLQTKLTVNVPGDEYEQEAERVATQVIGLDGAAPVAVRRQAGPLATSRVTPEFEHTISASQRSRPGAA